MIYKLSREAVSALEEIWLYTVENWFVAQADRYLNLIFTRLNTCVLIHIPEPHLVSLERDIFTQELSHISFFIQLKTHIKN
jgi:plasmid stabilization system protein ParE